MKLNFKVNPYYLVYHSLERAWGNKPFPEWVKLVEKVKSYRWFVFKDSEEVFTKIINDKQLRYAFSKTENVFHKIFKTHAFKRLLQETEYYRNWVEKTWYKNKDKALQILKDITGLKIPSITINVFITHPKLSNGSHIPKEKIILWGHPEEWKNYTIVYLCHELLHIIVYKKYKNDTLMHSLIELAIDNELRIRLNQRGKYFKEKGREIGHPELRAIEKKFLPLWKKYLKKELISRNILDLEKYLRNLLKK